MKKQMQIKKCDSKKMLNNPSKLKMIVQICNSIHQKKTFELDRVVLIAEKINYGAAVIIEHE